MDIAESTAAAAPATDAPVALFKKRAPKANMRKRPATPPPASASESEYSSEDEAGHRVKRRRKAGVVTASSAAQRPHATDNLEPTKYAADRSATIETTNDATKQSNWYDENAPDALSAKNLLGRTRSKPSSSAPTDPTPSNDGTYKGSSAYSSYIQRNPNAPSKQVGPVKAPTNLRTITILDLQPDVCKDYKQTGFCGFGDSCKFLHAREDYKQGWALERDWEIQTKGKKQAGTTVASANRAARLGEESDEEDDKLLEKIPFACVICKKPYKNPIVTRCGHYFCEACALGRYRKNPSCAACGASTNGVFNGAKMLQRLLDKKRERLDRKREKAREEGREVEDEEGGEK